MRIAVAFVIGASVAAFAARAADKIDFATEVKPILESTCLSCHGGEKPKAGLRLDARSAATEGGEHGTALVPGKPQMSPLYTSTILPPGDENIMRSEERRVGKEG